MTVKDTVFPADLSEQFVRACERATLQPPGFTENKGRKRVFIYYENAVMVCFPKDSRGTFSTSVYSKLEELLAAQRLGFESWYIWLLL